MHDILSEQVLNRIPWKLKEKYGENIAKLFYWKGQGAYDNETILAHLLYDHYNPFEDFFASIPWNKPNTKQQLSTSFTLQGITYSCWIERTFRTLSNTSYFILVVVEYERSS